MLVTFTTDAYENITYFSGVASRLLTLMGHSGKIPGAIKAKDVSQALANLQSRIKGASEPTANDEDDEDENNQNISLATRAIPLINLLKAAEKKNCDILWLHGERI